jgi:serine/threonine-protein kinase HipA
MATGAPTRQQVRVCIGKAGLPLGSLVYVQQGRRQHCAFAYDEQWLASPERFNVSADLQLTPGHQPHKAASQQDSVFHGALADTAPDAWGRRVIARDHAKRRRCDPSLPALTELDYLLSVDDFSRVGALRLRNPDGIWHRTVPEGRRTTPPLVELEHIYQASRAVERGEETTEDLRYLQGKGTSLGGMRPRCTIVGQDGRLAIGKFPSVNDTRSEVLALKLAQLAGIDAAPARIVSLAEVPVAVIRRFDRDGDDGRIPYLDILDFWQSSGMALTR